MFLLSLLSQIQISFYNSSTKKERTDYFFISKILRHKMK